MLHMFFQYVTNTMMKTLANCFSWRKICKSKINCQQIYNII